MRAACWSNKKTRRVNPKMLRLERVSFLVVVLIGPCQGLMLAIAPLWLMLAVANTFAHAQTTSSSADWTHSHT